MVRMNYNLGVKDMSVGFSCDTCRNYAYDEEYEEYACMVDMDEDDTAEFKKVKYVLHILDVLYPDLNKTPKENTEMLSQMDYNLKKECYEKVYGKELTYDFEPSDIAGWKKHYES